MTKTTTNIDALRLMVRGAYDLQGLRMQVGLRLVANFRSKLTDQPSQEEEGEDEMSEEAVKLIDQLKASYRRLTDGVARNRTLPDEKKFTGDELVSTFAELTLVDQYIRLEKQENLQFNQFVYTLEKIPIYNEYLKDQRGIGLAMAGVLITYLDPHNANHISSFWRFAGLDVAEDGAGRSRRKEHLVERTYINKAGEEATRMSVTYNPFLKTKLAGVLGPSFIKTGSPWRQQYDNRKHRVQTDPNRMKITVGEWQAKYKKLKRENPDATIGDMKEFWTPGRIHADANRYMVKMFLAEFWTRWRTLEGLPLTPTYHEGVMGHVHNAGKVA